MAVQVVDMGLSCHNCDNILKKERGCTDLGIIPFYIGDEVYFQCPLKIITNQSWEYIKSYALYSKGILPHGRGWLNESEKFLSAMFILEDEFGKESKSKADKMKQRKGAINGARPSTA